MENGSSERPMGVRADDDTEGRSGVCEPGKDPACFVPGTRVIDSATRSKLAAALAEIKELYERESAGLAEPFGALKREREVPRRFADDVEPDSAVTGIEAEGVKARAARAMAALAHEHEARLAAEVELDRLRAEVEGERERTREALRQGSLADERWQRAEAEAAQFRRDVEVRHHEAEQALTQLVEEANGLEQRLRAAEGEAAQFRQAGLAQDAFQRWPRLSAAASALIGIGIAVGVMSAWPRYFSSEPAPQPSAPILGAEQPRTLAIPAIQGERGQVQLPSPVAPNLPAEGDGSDSSQSNPQPKQRPQEQPIPAAPMQDDKPEGKLTPPSAASVDALPQESQAKAAQENSQANNPQRLQPSSTGDKTGSSPETTSPPPSSPSTSSTSPTRDTVPGRSSITQAVGRRISVYYRQSSPSARADAQRVATWITASGFGGSRLLRTKRAPHEQVVRYFFVEDSEPAGQIAAELRKRGGSWRAEDRTHDRHKPPPGSIQVWLGQVP